MWRVWHPRAMETFGKDQRGLHSDTGSEHSPAAAMGLLCLWNFASRTKMSCHSVPPASLEFYPIDVSVALGGKTYWPFLTKNFWGWSNIIVLLHNRWKTLWQGSEIMSHTTLWLPYREGEGFTQSPALSSGKTREPGFGRLLTATFSPGEIVFLFLYF